MLRLTGTKYDKKETPKKLRGLLLLLKEKHKCYENQISAVQRSTDI